MADPPRPAPMPSTGLMPAGVDSDVGVRPRNRRGQSGLNNGGIASNNLTPRDSPAASRGVSPITSRVGYNSKTNTSSGRASPSNAFSRGLLDGTWAPNWASVQDFATSLMAGGDGTGGYTSEPSRPSSRGSNKGKSSSKSIWKGLSRVGSGLSATSGSGSGNWGPAPPSKSRPTPDDIAAGSLREREARLMARKKASVLQSHEGVNGGLDVSGKYKRRNSDELPTTDVAEPAEEDHLVYLHHVQPTDTYAGIVLRYRCQESAFRKTNGIWAQNNIQIRKHVLIPVDACEVKGRPCEAPSYYSQHVDLLAATPQPTAGTSPRPQQNGSIHDDFFSSRATEKIPEDGQEQALDPWTHVRWVKMDSISTPVEIVRVSRRATGYFPPRRKRSVTTVSSFSTPRHSLELSKTVTNASEALADSPARNSSRRQSSMGSRPAAGSLGSSPATRGRSGSSLSGDVDRMPAWMRKPGGVGSMSRSVHAPGPATDSLNSWVNKRLPGFNIDTLPSMSVMGSESAQFGFSKSSSTGEARGGSGIVESPWEEGRDASNNANAKNGMGLEQAAASIETWLRGALSKRPGTSRAGSFRKQTGSGGSAVGSGLEGEHDLIEMMDTNSDDGRSIGISGSGGSRGLLDQDMEHGTTGLSSYGADGGSSFRGRARGNSGGAAKGKKAD